MYKSRSMEGLPVGTLPKDENCLSFKVMPIVDPLANKLNSCQ
jgi:hypothetical protein